jgi:predicted exporter
MKGARRKALGVSVLWLSVAFIAVFVLATRLQLSFDLSAFFPNETSLNHEILLEQLKNGPGSRLIVIGLSGGDNEQLAEASDELKLDLAENPLFINVLNGDFDIDNAAIPEPVSRYFPLMTDVNYSLESFRTALQARQRDLGLGGGRVLSSLIASDPFLQTLEILERLTPTSDSEGMWFAPDGSAVLLAETRAPAVDMAAQAAALEDVRQSFEAVPGSQALRLEMTGVGAFGVELQETIRAEAQKRTILATSVLLIILFVVYRKITWLLLAGLPIGMGFLVGLAAVTLSFGTVHGITLAFGFTLMGVAIDYPLHLFSHARQSSGASAIRRIWPTLRLGAASTAVAYIAIAFSGSDGLAQLGVFTASGLLVAALVTRNWLPCFLHEKSFESDTGEAGIMNPSISYWPSLLALVVALGSVYVFYKDHLWDDRLSSLSPVPEARLLTDAGLRSSAGTTDMRYQIVSHAPDLETLLLQSEAIDDLLQQAVEDDLLESWQSVSQVMPSRLLQERRRASIPTDEQLHSTLEAAVAATAFRKDAFQPYIETLSSARTLPPLGPQAFDDTPLSAWLDSHLVKVGGQWVSLVSVTGPEPSALAGRLDSWEVDVELVDLQSASLTLIRDYRHGAIKTLAVASVLIIVLLMLGQKGARKVAWVTLTVVSALLVTTTVVTVLHGGLTIIHLVALILVMGLGLDYALFISREENATEQAATRHAVLACAVTTTLTFAILAGSTIPVLKFLGLTVATGAATSYILAWTGSRRLNKRSA